VARLFQDGEELVSRECPADLKVFGRAVDRREEPRVIPAHVKKEEPLEIRVGVECGDHHLHGCDYGVESAWLEGHSLAEFDQHSTGSLPQPGRLGSGLWGVKVDQRSFRNLVQGYNQNPG
jgi:hypothetical protein